MVYIVIGIMLVVAVGTIITRRSRRAAEMQDTQEGIDGAEIEQQQGTVTTESEQAVQAEADTFFLSPGTSKREEIHPPGPQPTPSAEAPAEAKFSLEEEIVPLKPVLAAAPLSSPNALNSATYTSAAPQSAGESPYAYGNTVDEDKPKPESTLLRWSGKTGVLQVGDLTIRGAVAYWSNGPSSTPEPSCIDITLPVEHSGPGGENEISSEGAASYSEMTPLQRGVYLQWLAGGRIQPPAHACYPLVWIFGLERRVLSDRLDVGICIGEAFRLLPFVRWESLRQGLIKFITWMAAKVWLPEDDLLAFSRTLPTVPRELLNMLLRPYSDSRLPLPSVVAFTVMRTSSLAEENGLVQPQPFLHSNELMAQFSPKYKSKCEGGIVLPKPKNSIFVAYVPNNPTLLGDKKTSGGVLELPDFFKEADNFAPLIVAWKDFLKEAFPIKAEPLRALDEVEARPDWYSFVKQLQGLPNAEVSQDEGIFAESVMTDLGAMADLMQIVRSKDGKKIEAADRKKIAEAARIEGFLILPNLGIAGKEYRWDEPVSLTSFPPGERLSQDYNSAALTLEYACALTGLSDSKALSAMKSGLEGYFSLSSEDDVRLEALSSVLTASAAPKGGAPNTGMPVAEARMDPKNLGESLQFWLQREQRVLVGNFLARFLSECLPLEPGEQGEKNQNWIYALRDSLDVDTIQEWSTKSAEAMEKETPQPLELGSKVAQALAPLFTD